MKKRFLTVLTALALLLSSAALAEHNLTAYELSERDISVPMPSDFAVFQLDMPADDAVFALFGIDGPALLEHMAANAIYLDAITYDMSREIFVTANDSDMITFFVMTDSWLSAYGDEMAKQYATMGIEVTRHEVYRTLNAAYLMLWQNTGVSERIQCYTQVRGTSLTIMLVANEPVTEDDAALLRDILDGVRYDTSILPFTVSPGASQ